MHLLFRSNTLIVLHSLVILTILLLIFELHRTLEVNSELANWWSDFSWRGSARPKGPHCEVWGFLGGGS